MIVGNRHINPGLGWIMADLELFEAIRALKFDDEARVAAIKKRLDDIEREFEDFAARMVMKKEDLDFVCSL